MKHYTLMFVASLAIVLTAGCAAQQAKINAVATQVQADVVAAQPIVNAAACDAQKAANQATAAATALGDDKAATDAKLVSVATGTLCLTSAPVAAVTVTVTPVPAPAP